MGHARRAQSRRVARLLGIVAQVADQRYAELQDALCRLGVFDGPGAEQHARPRQIATSGNEAGDFTEIHEGCRRRVGHFGSCRALG